METGGAGMRRILVIGSAGAGKSTLALRLGARLGLEVIHLDAEHWRSGWVEPPREEWAARVEELLRRDAWVMDGNYSGTLARRLEACDAVVFLDLPRTLCVWRVLKRVVTYRAQTRPDMAPGCDERLDLKFLAWIWNYPTRSRPKVLALLAEHRHDKQIFHLRTRAEVEKFLAGLGG